MGIHGCRVIHMGTSKSHDGNRFEHLDFLGRWKKTVMFDSRYLIKNSAAFPFIPILLKVKSRCWFISHLAIVFCCLVPLLTSSPKNLTWNTAEPTGTQFPCSKVAMFKSVWEISHESAEGFAPEKKQPLKKRKPMNEHCQPSPTSLL